MKKCWMPLSLIAVLLLAFTLTAQPGRESRPVTYSRAGMLELTEAQEAQMRDLQLKLQKEILPLRSEIKKLRDEMKMELIAEKFNEPKVSKLNNQIADLDKQIQMKRLVHQRAVRDILTPDQQKKYDLRILSRGEKDGRWERQAPPRFRHYRQDFPQEQE